MSHLVRCLDWMSQPLALYAVVAAGLGLSLYLFITVKAEISALVRGRRHDQADVHGLRNALEETRRTIQGLESDLRDVERQTGMLVTPAPSRSGLNLSKRTQVLRRHRAGEDSAKIGSSLGLPRAEVDLLIKVQGILLRQI